MGNTTSCAPLVLNGGVIKVLFKDGRVQVFTKPIKAVELMLEHPRHFVCDSSDLKVGHRIPGLAADEELERRHLYLILPIEMLYSVLTTDEMDALSLNVSKVIRSGGSSNHIAKIFPIFGEFCIFPSEFKAVDAATGSKPGERYSKQRSWRPALDTIVENSSRL
ncbi:hypothetical protein FRX31_004263 [Thalictrum thalictroides]|uniref:Uncharacterized protein n=1 Tax=Thalictrum thalictroides TaxID=46969 RepID=A0A7J6XCG8_THATH|nr:hypothetical protein FRX31_004263 [Thalictrum thalictroides]